MTRTELIIGGFIAALVLATPLVFLVIRMCRPANRALLVAASWVRVLGLLLVPVVAWLWVIFRANNISVHINGVVEIALGLLWIVAIYLVWLAAPVAAVRWIVLKLMDRGLKRAEVVLVLFAIALTPAISGAQDTTSSTAANTRREIVRGQVTTIAFAHIAPPHQDAWFGIDKLKHFFMSVFIESVTYSALQAAHVKHRSALGGAIGVTMAVGVGREIHDSRIPGNLFSVRDLTWDAVGAAAGAVLSSHTIR
ncbi:MAG: VanZ family protein [Gemmatimonadaceae bacterium]